MYTSVFRGSSPNLPGSLELSDVFSWVTASIDVETGPAVEVADDVATSGKLTGTLLLST